MLENIHTQAHTHTCLRQCWKKKVRKDTMKKVMSWTELFTLNNTYGLIIIHFIDTSQVHVDFCPEGCKFIDSQNILLIPIMYQ